MQKLNGKGKSIMGNNRKSSFTGNARFLELGSLGQPFRSLINVDHLTNVRFEERIEQEDIPPQYDADGTMTRPPQQGEPMLAGWSVVLDFEGRVQGIGFHDQTEAVNCYNAILDMIVGVGCPTARMKKLEPVFHDPRDVPPGAGLVGANGEALDIPPLTDEELDQLENPVIDEKAIAEAMAVVDSSDDETG